MKHVALATDLRFPLDAVTQTFAILGKRGSGKTNTSGVMTEQMIMAGLPVVVVDPIGVWWGLRHDADGKSPGLPVVILGGEHADVPIEESSGVVIADFVIENRTPVVIDLGLFTKGAQRRFMVDFAERLYVKNRDALHVVLDECDTFVPQRIDHGGERLVGAINDIVRKGRARGIGVTLISQRPALVNKDVLTQIEVLVAHRMTGPQDRDAIERWVEHNADKDPKFLASLQVLEVGEAWVWSPGWLDIFKKTHINLRTTFDSSATPKAGARVRAPKNAAAVDLESLKTKLASTIERAKEDDPKELRQQITALKKQVAERLVETSTLEVPVLPAAVREAVEALEQSTAKLRDHANDVVTATSALQASLDDHVDVIGRVTSSMALAEHEAAKISRTIAKSVRMSTAAMVEVEPSPPRRRKIDSHNGLHVGSNPQLKGGERRILSALAQHGAMDRGRLALLAGYTVGGGGFLNLLSALRTKEYIERGLGDVEQITNDGARAVGFIDMLPAPGDALFQFWLNHPKLGKAHRSILVVLRKYGRMMTKEQIAGATEYEVNGGGFLNALSRLRTLGLIEGRSELQLVKDLRK